MLDIEFLQAERLRQPAHLVHLYEAGMFRADIREAVRTIANDREWLWQDLDPQAPALSSAGSLYGALLISIDLDAVLATTDASRTLAAVAAQVGANREAHFYIHGQGSSALHEMPAWDTILGAATVVHEPKVTSHSLPKLLAFLSGRMALDLAQLPNAVAAEDALRGWIAQTQPSLPLFVSSLELVLVSSIQDGVFDPRLFAEQVNLTAEVSGTWTLPLARFLRSKAAADRAGLLARLDYAYNVEAATPQATLGAIWRATFDLVKSSDLMNPDGKVPDGWSTGQWESNRAHRSIRGQTLLRWQMLLAQLEPTILNRGLPAWDGLLRQVQGLVKS